MVIERGRGILAVLLFQMCIYGYTGSTGLLSAAHASLPTALILGNMSAVSSFKNEPQNLNPLNHSKLSKPL